MNIHLISDRFHMGGGVEHIYQIVRGLPQYHFTIFAAPGEMEKRFAGMSNVSVRSQGWSSRDLLSQQPNILHFHHFRPLVRFFANPLRKSPPPVLFTAHGMHIHKYEFSKKFSHRCYFRLRFLLEKRILSKPSRIIAVSREDKNFMETRYGLKQVTYLTNGIDEKKITLTGLQPLDLKESLGLGENTTLFLTVARFNFQKGHDILLRAIHHQFTRFVSSDVVFLLAGGGEEYHRMKSLSRTLGIENIVFFLGERHDVYDLMNACDVVLLPSRWEGLPIVLLEAGWLKKPVIASNTYGNREIITSRNGILFHNEDAKDLADKLVSIIQGTFDLDRMAGNLNLEIRKNYTLERMLRGLRDIYTKQTI